MTDSLSIWQATRFRESRVAHGGTGHGAAASRSKTDAPDGIGRQGERRSPGSGDLRSGVSLWISSRSWPSASISASTSYSADRSTDGQAVLYERPSELVRGTGSVIDDGGVDLRATGLKRVGEAATTARRGPPSHRETRSAAPCAAGLRGKGRPRRRTTRSTLRRSRKAGGSASMPTA